MSLIKNIKKGDISRAEQAFSNGGTAKVVKKFIEKLQLFKFFYKI